MNKFSKVVLAGVVSLTAVAGAANASEFLMEKGQLPSGVSEHGYAYQTGFITKAAQHDGVKIRYTHELSQAIQGNVNDQANLNQAAVRELQSEIRQDPALVQAFASRGIDLSNVVGSYQALDGSTTYIVR